MSDWAKHNKFLRGFYFWLLGLGWDLAKTQRALGGFIFFWRDYRRFKKQWKKSQSAFAFHLNWPCLDDRFEKSGEASGHYFHQDLLVSQRIFELNPKKHVDVGSRLDGFVAHVAAFRSIEVFDIRVQTVVIPNITFRQIDLMQLPESFKNYCDSLSCLHVLEHFGLGRYGDPLDVEGYRKGFQNLSQLLKPQGRFYFSVPIGPPRVEFNAHRVFTIEIVEEMLKSHFEKNKFSYVDDKGALHRDEKLDSEKIKSSCGCYFGCGIWELVKRNE